MVYSGTIPNACGLIDIDSSRVTVVAECNPAPKGRTIRLEITRRQRPPATPFPDQSQSLCLKSGFLPLTPGLRSSHFLKLSLSNSGS